MHGSYVLRGEDWPLDISAAMPPKESNALAPLGDANMDSIKGAPSSSNVALSLLAISNYFQTILISAPYFEKWL
jgi:hypothetical protein